MASLIPGFEYDIFISYRQKDNKHDGWVTEFVDNLIGELESTFKEEISVYFDINPHDGLLETHDVDASLKEKLKCLVFIPIISRTYCDPKSFAWEHEFKAFVEQASGDQFGLKIKLTNGNVASRVLPVRIHDLDTADIKLCEYFLGGVLRGVEFIYKEPGVNRPLTPDDDEDKNLNRNRYKNQINKVALAINELIQGLMTEPEWEKFEKRIEDETLNQLEENRKQEKKKDRLKPAKSKYKRAFQGLLLLILFIASLIIAYPRLFKHDILDKMRSSGERISVAVMPFMNLTMDTALKNCQYGIQYNLITSLSNSEELRVRQIETINSLLQGEGLTSYASITPSGASKISQKLDADIFIQGSINQSASVIRVDAQLIDSKTEEVFKSFQIAGNPKNIFNIIDSLSKEIKDFLIISGLKKEYIDFSQIASSNSLEAYRYFTYGQNAFGKSNFEEAINLFRKAVSIDSNLTYATLHICWAYGNMGMYKEAKKWCLKAYDKRERMPYYQRIYTNFVHASFFETPHESIKYLLQLQEIDNQWPHLYYDLGWNYFDLQQYDKSITEYEKALELYNKWGIKPWWNIEYCALGNAYHKTGQYKKEKKLYKKAEQDFPDDLWIISYKTILLLTERDTVESNLYLDKCISICQDNSLSPADIKTKLAWIYSEAGIFDKAEEFYRQALSLEPENLFRVNNLAYFLIDKGRNVTEGMELIDHALELSPDYYSYLDTKGWGLYKLGKYQEAIEVLQKSWDLRMQNAIYDSEAFRHLEAADKAVAGQK